MFSKCSDVVFEYLLLGDIEIECEVATKLTDC